jgi:hypothetical protein
MRTFIAITVLMLLKQLQSTGHWHDTNDTPILLFAISLTVWQDLKELFKS